MGTPGSPPTRVSVVPDKWVRPIRRLVDLSVGPSDLTVGPADLICGPKDLPEDSSRRPYPIRIQDLEYASRRRLRRQIDRVSRDNYCNRLEIGSKL